MSDIPADYRDLLDLRAVIAEIDRKQAETKKLQQESDMFVAEQRKLIAESDKFAAEQRKLMAEGDKLRAEGRKLNRETVLAPLIAAIALVGGVLGVASFIARFLT